MARMSKFKNWLEGLSEPLDESMIEELGSTVKPEEPTPFEIEHRREKGAYRRFTRWTHTKGEENLRAIYIAASIIVCIALIGVLVYACLDMPSFGKNSAMIDNELSEFYVEEGLQHTGATNIVTSIIMEFRGFDTLGESHVLFIAASMVIMLMYVPKSSRVIAPADSVERHFEPTHDEVLKHCSRILMPFIIVFAIYILLNGHLSPGGGFSGGAVLGAGMILLLEAFGPHYMDNYVNFKMLRRMMTCALVFYAMCKMYIFFTGANEIENGLSIGVFGHILSGGLLMPINMAVGIVVACTMYTLYSLFRRKGELN